MALVNDTQLTALAGAILDANASYLTADQKTASIPKMKEMLRQMMAYITGNAEVDVNMPVGGAGTVETFVAGSGSNGGALASATGGPVSGTIKAATGKVS